jgi:hypothetical protein
MSEVVYLDDLCEELAGDDYIASFRAKHLLFRWINRIPQLKRLTTIKDCEICITDIIEFNDILLARMEDGTLKSTLLANYLQNLRSGFEAIS